MSSDAAVSTDGLSDAERASVKIESITPVIGLEIHVELMCASKVFSSAPNPAAVVDETAGPNTFVDPVILALPGALPVLNRRAVELSIVVGLSLGCSIGESPKWDRKGYTYPDLPKGYQISQYDLPVCFDGQVELPAIDEEGEPDWTTGGRQIGVMRAHLEEDAGKLLHEAPGGGAIEGSIVDLNRAGAPLLEIVTQPDFRSAGEVVAFCRLLRWLCRAAGATHGVLERGHMRFEPNINCELRLSDGRLVRTPITEVKNLNSFSAVRSAIEYELAEQPGRWRRDGRELGPGTKRTFGWDDGRSVTIERRAKEDADDYRYFPDPDLPTLSIEREEVERLREAAPTFPTSTLRSLINDHRLQASEALLFIENADDTALYLEAVRLTVSAGVEKTDASRGVANLLAQHAARLVNERSDVRSMTELGCDPQTVSTITQMRSRGDLSAANAGLLLERMVATDYAGRDPEAVAEYEGWLAVRDASQLEAWCDEVIEANGPIVDQIRGGKQQAVGRLIGEVMSKSGGAADAKTVRAMLLERIGES